MKTNWHFEKLSKAHNIQKAYMCHRILCWIEVNNFSLLLLLCRNQYNNLMCKSMDWFLRYSNTGLNELTKLKQITGKLLSCNIYMSTSLNVQEVGVVHHHSLLDHRQFPKSFKYLNLRYILTFLKNFELLFICFLWSDLF